MTVTSHLSFHRRIRIQTLCLLFPDFDDHGFAMDVLTT